MALKGLSIWQLTLGITPQMCNKVTNPLDIGILVFLTETGAASLEFFKTFSSII